MRSPSHSLLRTLFVLVPALGVLAGVIVALNGSSGSNREPSGQGVPTATETVAALRDSGSSSSTPTATSQSATPLAGVATPTPIANRADCEVIRGDDYNSPEERVWFLDNCVTLARGTSASIAPAAGAEGGLIRASGDRLVIERLGIDAPVNYRTVEEDGILGNPVGAFDIVWYDFSNLRGLGGYPGRRGNAVYAGHVDYYGVGPAVFWNLRNIAKGDVIEVQAVDGTYRYAVDWFADYSPSDNWSSIVAWSSKEVITLITCIGTFEPGSGYTNRRVVRASRIE